jgi:cellulose synthase/poly-beta-1,6-N-acetylglucosamine synthase-like glycosyltransferase
LTTLQTLPVEALAAAMALLAAPLLADLAVCLVGNLRRPRQQRPQAKRGIRLAAVIPAHDEEATVARAVRSLIAAGCADAGKPEEDCWKPPVFVVAHNCTDRTIAKATEAGARVVLLNDPNLRGKGGALRAGFAAASKAGANAFLVLDADSVAGENLTGALQSALAAGAAAAQCRYELELPKSGARALARLRVVAFRGINVLRARGRAGLGFSAGVFGNGFALTAETLHQVPFAVDSICEDLEYHARLVAAGLRVAWVEEAHVYAPLAPQRRAQAVQEARWEGGRFHVAARSMNLLLKALFRGNWRALEMMAEAWSLPLSRGVLTLALMALMPVPWLHVAAIAGAAIVAAYAVEAAFLGREPGRDLAALACAPAHILWKLAITPLVLKQTRSGAEWARTRREARQP